MARSLIPVLVVTSAAAVMLTGCGIQAAAPGSDSAAPGAPVVTEASVDAPGEILEESSAPKVKTSKPATTAPKSSPRTEATKTTSHQPKIVYFRIKQKPKCPEGTAVFRAPAVPLVIEWKITGAESGALSVDDPTHTPGTYGATDLKGTQEFTFSCGGPVGSVEKHTYAIYTVGGGTQKSKTISATAKVMDAGLGTE